MELTVFVKQNKNDINQMIAEINVSNCVGDMLQSFWKTITARDDFNNLTLTFT